MYLWRQPEVMLKQIVKAHLNVSLMYLIVENG